MAARTATRPVPRTLEAAGKKLWREIAGEYELRPDEYRVLEDACREADLIELLAKAQRDEPLLIEGSQGQMVLNPLVSELRQHRATLSGLLAKLKLPDLPDEGEGSGGGGQPAPANDRSAKARDAANARWSRRGA
ncbi:hypothetical protein [Nocardioides aquiterrae]|uniref:Terminase n=1 Tax=Nocardioides aquiterrae TaxID=203799 RepID=A0ABN1UC50_9ACTN